MLNQLIDQPTICLKEFYTSTETEEVLSIPEKEEPEVVAPGSDAVAEANAPQTGKSYCPPSLPDPPQESSPNDFLCAEAPLDYHTDQHSKGYFKIPRSLRDHPLFESSHAMHRIILYTIIEHVAWKPTKFDDHGTVIDIAPGELCVSLRELSRLSGPGCNKNWVVGALKWFSRASDSLTQILRHQVRHERVVITILHKDTYDQIIYRGQTAGQTAIRQRSDTKEKEKQLNSESCPVQYSTSVVLNDVQRKVVERLHTQHNIDLPAAEFAACEYSEHEIIGALKQRKRSRTQVHHETHWLLATLKKKRESLKEYERNLRPQEQEEKSGD